MENTYDETVQKEKQVIAIYISSVKQVQVSPSQLIHSVLTWFSDALCFYFHQTDFAMDLENEMTAVFLLALQHFASSTYHLIMCSIMAHYMIIKLKMRSVVDD